MNIKNIIELKDGRFDVQLEDPTLGWIPFTVSKNDNEDFGRELHLAISNGDFGEYKPYVFDKEKELLELANEMREERDSLLWKLDSYIASPLRWESFDTSHKGELSTYRESLLSIPDQEGFPDKIVWPKCPFKI